MPNEMANFLALDNNYWNKNVEYLLCGLTIPTDNKILLDPKVWIANTGGASMHIKAHKEGLRTRHKKSMNN
jgi:hypothetical protein